MSRTYVKTKDGKIGFVSEDHDSAEWMVVIFKSQWCDEFGNKTVTNPEKSIVPYKNIEITDTNLYVVASHRPMNSEQVIILGSGNFSYPRHW
jgi:hypothetical protein